MNCEHAFVPFPGSLAKLYCSRCGVGREAFATPPSPRAPRAPVARRRRQTEPMAPTLFDRANPDRDAAAQVVADADLAKLEDAVRAIVAESNLEGRDAEDVIAAAVEFGPELDLDQFASRVAAMPARRAPEFADSEA